MHELEFESGLVSNPSCLEGSIFPFSRLIFSCGMTPQRRDVSLTSLITFSGFVIDCITYSTDT